MRSETIQIIRGLPEEICEHREWIEVLDIMVEHDPEYKSPSFYVDIDALERLVDYRAKEICREIQDNWDYLRIAPEVEAIPDYSKNGRGRWKTMRIYARAYRLRPMNNVKAAIARGLIADLLADKIKSDEAVEMFNNRTGGLT